jgi:hypothetical protein
MGSTRPPPGPTGSPRPSSEGVFRRRRGDRGQPRAAEGADIGDGGGADGANVARERERHREGQRSPPVTALAESGQRALQEGGVVTAARRQSGGAARTTHAVWSRRRENCGATGIRTTRLRAPPEGRARSELACACTSATAGPLRVDSIRGDVRIEGRSMVLTIPSRMEPQVGTVWNEPDDRRALADAWTGCRAPGVR